MGERSHIEWTDATWNPLVGCTKVSPGCDHCYAETFVNRFAGHNAGFPNRFDVVTMRGEKMLTQPLRWRKPRKVFVNSLSDLFHTDVPDAFIAQVFAVMALAPQHTFQLLTKRHARMRSLLSSIDFANTFHRAVCDAADWDVRQPAAAVDCALALIGDTSLSPLPNAHLGVSVEDQHWADIRIPALLDTPAAVRWISAEPLLGPVTFRWAKWQMLGREPGAVTDHLDGLRGLDWVVVGGESGPGARPMHPQWARDLRDQCAGADVPFLFKQWGNWAPGSDSRHRQCVVARTGQTVEPVAALWTAPNTYDADLNRMDWAVVHHAGKKAAGRELDGRTHDEYPVRR